MTRAGAVLAFESGGSIESGRQVPPCPNAEPPLDKRRESVSNMSTHEVFFADTEHQLNKDLFSSFCRAVERLRYRHQQLITQAFRHRSAKTEG